MIRSVARRGAGTAVLMLLLSALGLGCVEHDDYHVGTTHSTMGMLSEQFAAVVSLEVGFSDFSPRDSEELYTVLHKRGYIGDDIMNRVDAWSHPYVLQSSTNKGTGRFYAIVSMGPDGVLGTNDDIQVSTRVPYRLSASTPSSAPATSSG